MAYVHNPKHTNLSSISSSNARMARPSVADGATGSLPALFGAVRPASCTSSVLHKCPPDLGGSPKGVRGPRVPLLPAAVRSGSSSPSFATAALPILFNHLDGERLEDAVFRRSSPSPPPPSYSSLYVSAPAFSSVNHNNNNNNDNVRQPKHAHPVLSLIPLVGSPSSISTLSSRSSNSTSSSSSSSDDCFSDDAASSVFAPEDYLESVFLPSSLLLASRASATAFDDDVFHGAAVASSEGAGTTLVVSLVPGAAQLDGLRERVVDLLERADEELEAKSILICLDKREPLLADLIHSLLYVGGAVIAPENPTYAHGQEHVLVGLEL